MSFPNTTATACPSTPVRPFNYSITLLSFPLILWGGSVASLRCCGCVECVWLVAGFTQPHLARVRLIRLWGWVRLHRGIKAHRISQLSTTHTQQESADMLSTGITWSACHTLTCTVSWFLHSVYLCPPCRRSSAAKPLVVACCLGIGNAYHSLSILLYQCYFILFILHL